MHIKEDLIYSKHTGELIGFIDIGDINNNLLQLEQSYTKDKESTPLAKTVLILMIRGLFSDFNFPYATFPSTKLTGEQLVPIIYEAILRVELCGFKVTCITLDGNSVNRKLFKLIGDTTSKVVHKCVNPLSLNKRQIFFFSDPPHLIKTARNCLASSKRNMQVYIMLFFLFLLLFFFLLLFPFLLLLLFPFLLLLLFPFLVLFLLFPFLLLLLLFFLCVTITLL